MMRSSKKILKTPITLTASKEFQSALEKYGIKHQTIENQDLTFLLRGTRVVIVRKTPVSEEARLEIVDAFRRYGRDELLFIDPDLLVRLGSLFFSRYPYSEGV